MNPLTVTEKQMLVRLCKDRVKAIQMDLQHSFDGGDWPEEQKRRLLSAIACYEALDEKLS